jgi:selenocysteine lyase/cysteine desulfurase
LPKNIHIATIDCAPSGSARASFYLYNTLEEVERLGVALRKTLSILRR